MTQTLHLVIPDRLDLPLAALLESVLDVLNPLLELLSVLLLVLCLLCLVVLSTLQLLIVLLHEVTVQLLQHLLVVQLLVELPDHCIC